MRVRYLVMLAGLVLAGLWFWLELPSPEESRPSTGASLPLAEEPPRAPRAERPRDLEPRVAPPASPARRAEPLPEEDFLRKVEELRSSDKHAALELARQGADWYPDEGVYAEARKAMVATLLVDLGQMAEARAEVRLFIERHPESRYRPMLQGITGIHPRPGAPKGIP